MEELKLFPEKMPDEGGLAALAESWRGAGRRISLVTGCFDPLCADLAGQLRRAAGDGRALVVGVFSDEETARRLKGAHPLIDAAGRRLTIAAVEFVDAAVTVDGAALERIIETLKPDETIQTLECLLEFDFSVCAE